jgi:hypothetical protein
MVYDEHLDAHNKSLRDLGMEAFWFVAHTVIAVIVLVCILFVGVQLKPDPDAIQPKIIGTALAFVLPLIVGFLIAKATHNDIGRYVWISGMLIFASVCVWVLDLPTGAGLCEHCGALDKLWRTFFDITHGSGLMGGDGLMVGVWIPLAMFGYAAGASLMPAASEQEAAE